MTTHQTESAAIWVFRWSARATSLLAGLALLAALSASAIAAPQPRQTITRFFAEARTLLAYAQSAAEGVNGAALGREQRAAVTRELTTLRDATRALRRLPRSLGQEVERFTAFTATRAGHGRGLRELRYQSVVAASEQIAAKLADIARVLEGSRILRPGSHALAHPRSGAPEPKGLTASLWDGQPPVSPDQIATLRTIIPLNEALQADLAALSATLDRVLTELPAD